MATGDVYQVEIWNTLQGDTNNIWTFHVIEDGAPAGTVEDDLNDHFSDHVVDNLLSFLADVFTFTCIDTKKIYDALSNSKLTSVPRQLSLTGKVGTDVNDSLPGQCSLVMQEIGDLDTASPTSRGRLFINGASELSQADGEWDQTWAQGVIGVFNTNLLGGFTGDDGGTYRWGVVSQKILDQTPPGTFFTEIEQLRGLKQVRTQRRRQPLDPCDRYFPLLPG